MTVRTVAVAVGASITAFLLVAVAVIELLAVEFSALVGLPAGLLAGAVVFAAVLLRYGSAAASVRRGTAAAAAFGYAVLVLLAVRYVNLAGLRQSVTLDRLVGVAVLAAAAVYLGLWARQRRAVG